MSKKDIANKYADMIIFKKMSLREVAESVGVSKSTVHRYVTKYTTGFFRKWLLKRRLAKNLKEAEKKYFNESK